MSLLSVLSDLDFVPIDMCQRIGQIEGSRPITATALVAAVGDKSCFKNGRQFAAWLGLVSKPHSSGGKPWSETSRACSVATGRATYQATRPNGWGPENGLRSRCAVPSANPGQKRALASNHEEPGSTRKQLPVRRS